jgi:HEAT repeat protein
MKNRKTLLVLVACGAFLLTGAYIVYARWLVDFVVNWSDDIVMNSIHLLGVCIPLALASAAEGMLMREAWHFYKGLTEPEEDLDLDDLQFGRRDRTRDLRAKMRMKVKRQIRETWTLWLVFMGLPLAVNVLVMNASSGGYVLSGQGGLTRYATVATLLRSEDPAAQGQGVEESVGLTEKSLGRYLAAIIAARGEHASEAAWAAATRGDEDAVVPLRWMFLKGDEEQRRRAVISLARLGDRRGAELTLKAVRRGEGPLLECIVALGLAAHVPAEDDLIAFSGDPERPEMIRAASMWAVTEIEKGRFERAYLEQKSPDLTPRSMKVPPRRGFEPMLEALDGDSEMLRCAAIQGLRYAGPVETAEVLMKVFDASEHMDKCQSLALEHHESTRYEIVKFGLVRSLLVDSLAGVGNRSIGAWLEKQADDRKNADEVILKARDLARQIRTIR